MFYVYVKKKKKTGQHIQVKIGTLLCVYLPLMSIHCVSIVYYYKRMTEINCANGEE